MAILAALGIFIAGDATSTAAAVNRDPKAEEVARTMMQAMGGQQVWDATHFIRFDFKVVRDGQTARERSHLWDKWSGRYRLETKTKEGQNKLILFTSLHEKQGSANAAGKKLEGQEAEKALEDGYGPFINDTYWLAMPWKRMDPGVNLKCLGRQTRGGNTFDVVELTFDYAGLTPGDKYDAFVSQKSHLMTHWEYTLQSNDKGAWDWQYGDHGGIKLASNHTNEQKTSINVGDIRVLNAVSDTFFTDPSKSLSQLK